MAYDIQLTVIKYKKKTYISHLAAIAIEASLDDTSLIQFGNRTLIEVKQKDKKLIKDFPVYDLDAMIQIFENPDKSAEAYLVPKKDCFNFDGHLFVPLSKIKIKNKYTLRFLLPAVKIFGTYYIQCNKQKDKNTRIFIKPE